MKTEATDKIRITNIIECMLEAYGERAYLVDVEGIKAALAIFHRTDIAWLEANFDRIKKETIG